MTFVQTISVPGRVARVAVAVLLTGCTGSLADAGSDDAANAVTTGAGATSGASNTSGVGGGGGSGGGEPMVQPGDDELVCPSHASFCESFEDGIDTSRWPEWTDLAAGWSFADEGAAGKHALRLRGGPSVGLMDGVGSHIVSKNIPAPDDRLYMRVFLRFVDLGLPGWHPIFFQGLPSYWTGDWVNERSLYFGSLRNDFCVTALGEGTDVSATWIEEGTDYIEGGDMTPTTEQGIQSDEWFCLELMMYGDNQGDADTDHGAEEVKAWVNGEPVDKLGMGDAWVAMWSGSEHWMLDLDGSQWSFNGFGDPGREYDVWYDGIAFSTQRIGCGKQ